MANQPNNNEYNNIPWKLIGQFFLVGIAIVLIVVFGWQVKSISILGLGLEPPATPTSTQSQQTTTVSAADSIAPVSAGKLLFSDDFESGKNDNVAITGGNWSVIDDGTGNYVLNADSTNTSWSYGRFSSSFADGIIEYRVRVITFDTSIDSNSGGAFLIFRESPTGLYQFVISPQNQNAAVYSQGGNGGPWTLLQQGQNFYQYNFQKDAWYSVRIEARTNKIKVFVDGSIVVSTQDSLTSSGGLGLAIAPSTIAQFDDVHVSTFTP